MMIADVIVGSINMYRLFLLPRIHCVGREGRQCSKVVGLAGNQGGVEEKHEDDAGRYFISPTSCEKVSEVDENYVLCPARYYY